MTHPVATYTAAEMRLMGEAGLRWATRKLASRDPTDHELAVFYSEPAMSIPDPTPPTRRTTMKVTVMKPTEVEVAGITICVPVDFEDEDMPYDFPLRKGDQWCATVDMDTGQIRDWPGMVMPCDIFMKVADAGVYTLLGPNGEEIARLEDYVPDDAIPGDSGDYIDFTITDDGQIKNWLESPDLSAFFPRDEDEDW